MIRSKILLIIYAFITIVVLYLHKIAQPKISLVLQFDLGLDVYLYSSFF